MKFAFIHHTVSANDYGPEDSAAMVLGICRYHRNSNGWNDIGYNFLVDRYGTIFEGRAGGIAEAVVGAQAQGYNSQSTGISSIGTFSTAGQTEAGLRAIAHLLGWKLGVHGVPARGRVSVVSGGGSTNRYPAGSRPSFERISGHRDANGTACPGNGLYGQLEQLRGDGGTRPAARHHGDRRQRRRAATSPTARRPCSSSGSRAPGRRWQGRRVNVQLLGRARMAHSALREHRRGREGPDARADVLATGP